MLLAFVHKVPAACWQFVCSRWVRCLGVAEQVPFMAWMGAVPLMGGPVQRVLQASARPLASLALAATGAQFFLNDRAASAAAPDPLLVHALPL